MKAIKITNPLWLGNIAPVIQKLMGKINIPTITYETLYTFFVQTIQHGDNRVEFWTVQDDNGETAALALWSIRPLPYISTVYCHFIYSWNRAREPIELLFDEFEEFGKKNKCLYYQADTLNEALFRVFRKAASKKGYELKKTGAINFLGRKK